MATPFPLNNEKVTTQSVADQTITPKCDGANTGRDFKKQLSQALDGTPVASPNANNIVRFETSTRKESELVPPKSPL